MAEKRTEREINKGDRYLKTKDCKHFYIRVRYTIS